MKRALLAALIAAFLLGACGDDGDSGFAADADPEAVATVKASLMEEEDGFALADDDADCVAQRIASDFGAERVEEIDWEATAPAFTDDEARSAVSAFRDCVDLGELFASSIGTEDVSEDSLDCVAEQTDDGDVAALFEQSFSADGEITDELVAPLDAVLQECLTAEEYEAVG
jgi:hypothetical protein